MEVQRTCAVDAPESEITTGIGANHLKKPGLSAGAWMMLSGVNMIPAPADPGRTGTFWPGTVTQPPKYAGLGNGRWLYAQLITFSIRLQTGSTIQVPEDPANLNHSLNEQTGIDVSFPYNDRYHEANGVDGDATHNPQGDAPGVGVESLIPYGTTVVANHRFTTYMMYLPPDSAGLPSTYVPLRKFQWNWTGHGGPFYSDMFGNVTGVAVDDGSVISAQTQYPGFPSWSRIVPAPTNTITVP